VKSSPTKISGQFDVILDPVGGPTRIANQGLLARTAGWRVYGAVIAR